MSNIYARFRCVLSVCGALLWWSHVHAADTFAIAVFPDTFVEGDPVDFEIRAVSDDAVVDASVVNGVYMYLTQGSMPLSDDGSHSLPSNGIYDFVPEDQGIKRFSKGLIVNEPGTYELNVELLEDSSVKGVATIVVTEAGDVIVGDASISISNPVSGTVVDSQSIVVLGTSDSPRTPLAMLVNDVFVETDFVTDAAGGFNIPVGGLVVGDNTVAVVLLDADGNRMGTSDVVSLQVAIDDSPLLQSFVVTPEGPLSVGSQAQVVASVAPRVTSVSLSVDDGSFPLDRQDDGTYTGTLELQEAGTYDLLLQLYVDGVQTEQDVDDIVVEAPVDSVPVKAEIYGIGEISYVVDPLRAGSVSVSWEAEGLQSSHYGVYYGTNTESLDNTLLVDRNEVILSDLSLGDPTYIQVWPTDADGNVLGDPSDPLVVGFQAASPQCIVKGIQLRSEQRGSDHYLVWSPVEGATSYTIYRSDDDASSLTDMDIVGTTTRTSYRYPFDPRASHETYAYYAIEATCEGGLTEPVGGIEKVKTGPVSSALTVMLLVAGVYFLYRVNMYQE